jgi:sugar O-acyltransferase (sialic acid O-acetyltransferase NeuD family)
MATLLILGAGGHGRVVADAALRQAAWTSVIASDRDPARCSAGELLPGVTLVPLAQAFFHADAVHVAIGNAQARQAEAHAAGLARLATVIHPGASVSAHARVGAGCFIAAQAVVAPGATLGTGVIVNHGAVADHDVVIGDFCHLAPRCAVGGGVRLGQQVLVGAGASVLPGLAVCGGAVLGAGAVVHRPVDQPGRYAGVPARRMS